LKPFIGNEETKEEEKSKGEESKLAIVDLTHEETCNRRIIDLLDLENNHKLSRNKLHFHMRYV